MINNKYKKYNFYGPKSLKNVFKDSLHSLESVSFFLSPISWIFF